MFTGLVQGLGQIAPLGAERLRVSFLEPPAPEWGRHIALGDSIAVDGVCLTVETFTKEGFSVAVSPETLARSSLAQTGQSQRPVNLEPSLRVGDKLGGHFVTGHVDGVGALSSAEKTAQAWELTFRLDSSHNPVARYLVPKGSIAVNGISLTVAHWAPESLSFRVAVIPHTYFNTNLQYLRPGDAVNLEGDILGKYVDNLLRVPQPSTPAPEITLDFLAEQGY
ncbi:MAG: riboflavin synthase [Cyanobacteriota bacterium]|nr:riboflavin synthase [Cyanobacteriota bacterium]